MDLFEGLEKFGLKKLNTKSIFSDEENNRKQSEPSASSEEKTEHSEEEFLLARTVHCPVCEKTFMNLSVKNGRLRRIESDFDLRPRFQYIDTNKYDVTSCPKCGYTALNRFFTHITTGQIRLIREGVCDGFVPEKTKEEQAVYSYEQAVERYKLALYNAVVKKGKTSEKAYICLKLSWVYRGWQEGLADEGLGDSEELSSYRKEERLYYEQAFDGFIKAIQAEVFPICGMDENTLYLLLANMAVRLEKVDIASKLISYILVSRTASSKIKDKARDLKEEIIQRIHRPYP